MIETTTVEADNERRERRHRLGRHLRLQRNDDGGDVAERFRIRIEPQAAPRQRGDFRRRLRLEHRDVLRIEAEPQPAFEQGAAHFAGADQHEQAGEIAQIGNRRGRGHASPEVSNIAESIASRADLPAQITNWNAGK